MNDKILRRWALWGALALAALMTSACDGPEGRVLGSQYEGRVNDAQDRESFVDESAQEPPATGGAGLGEPVEEPDSEHTEPDPEHTEEER